MKFAELIFAQSGGLFEAQAFAAPCEVSRTTVQSYLSILETTLLATVLSPTTAGGAAEIRTQPKVYGFDTGFVAYHRGWDSLRDEDRGQLLEHLCSRDRGAFWCLAVCTTGATSSSTRSTFVLEVARRRDVLAIECKSDARKLDPGA